MRILILVILCLLPCGAGAKNLYVNGSTGNDSTTYANNTSEAPWATIGRAAWGSTNRAAPNSSQAAAAGDVVYIAPGTYDTTTYTDSRLEPVYNPVNSGSSGSYITFAADGGTVTLTSSATSGSGEPMIGTNQTTSYIKWDGFTIDQDDINYRDGGGLVNIWGDYTTISNCALIGAYTTFSVADNHAGIFVSGSEGDEIEGTIIEQNSITGFTGLWGRNNAGITLYSVGQIDIRHNNVYSNDCGMYIKGGDSTGPIDIYLNLVYSNISDGIDLHNSAANGSVYQNVVRNNGMGIGFHGLQDRPLNMIVANNTIHSNAYNVYWNWDCSQISSNTFQNNIVSGGSYAHNADECTSIGEVTSARIASDRNLYYGSSTFASASGNYTFSTWKSTFSQDANSLSSDPLYTNSSGNDFTLQVGSPALGAGIDILDLDGDSSTVDAITMGAYITGNEVIGIGGEEPTPIQGVCGDESPSSIEPAENLCSSGTAGTVSLSGGNWVWICEGINSDTDDSCSAQYLEPPASTAVATGVSMSECSIN